MKVATSVGRSVGRPEIPSYVMQLEVEPAGIADWFSLVVAPPEGRRRRLAVGALKTHSTSRGLLRNQNTTLSQNTTLHHLIKTQFYHNFITKNTILHYLIKTQIYRFSIAFAFAQGRSEEDIRGPQKKMLHAEKKN